MSVSYQRSFALFFRASSEIVCHTIGKHLKTLDDIYYQIRIKLLIECWQKSRVRYFGWGPLGVQKSLHSQLGQPEGLTVSEGWQFQIWDLGQKVQPGDSVRVCSPEREGEIGSNSDFSEICYEKDDKRIVQFFEKRENMKGYKIHRATIASCSAILSI